MKKLKFSLICAFVLSVFTAKAADETPLWMRYSAISPDGSQIVFAYKGDLYKVPAQGGVAVQLTTNDAYDFAPVWSPDSKTIAFASNRFGNYDVFTMPVEGGVPERITFASTPDFPMAFSKDGKNIYMRSLMLADYKYSQFPQAGMFQLYTIPAEGGRRQMVTSVNMDMLSLNSDATKLLYQDKKGFEDDWRKHHTSSVTRDIWIYDLATREHQKVSDFVGENRNPVFVPGNDDFFYYLNEKTGSLNIWKRSLKDGSETQVTSYENHPVRFVTVADNGTLSYFYNGELYTMKEGAAPEKVNVIIRSDDAQQQPTFMTFRGGINDMAVSPTGREVAFIVRGDVFVASADHGTTVNITNTPEQERSLTWSPDGRTLAYAAERNGFWNIYASEIVRDGEDMFTYATEIKEKQITEGEVARFQPSFSPDGKEIAFLENRTTLRVINLKSEKMRTVLDGNYNYSYTDGDQWYSWSPDGEWFAVNFFEKGGWNNVDLGMVKADGSGEIHNLTQSGYSNAGSRFVLNGDAILFYSDEDGFRSHGSWGAQQDLYIAFFNQEAMDRFNMDREDMEVRQMRMTAKEARKEAKADSAKVEDPKTVYDFDNIKDRTFRLTPMSSFLGDALLTPDGSQLFFLTRFEGAFDLWVRDMKSGDTRMVSKLGMFGAFDTDKSGAQVFMLGNGMIGRFDLNSGRMMPISVAAEFNYRPAQEREYMFSHAWQQVVDKFYDPQIHGIDWKMYKETYERFLPHINNSTDFAEMLSEMLGELNASHTGARAFAGRPGGDATAALGMFFDNSYEGDGLKIVEIMDQNPMMTADSKMKPGVIIKAIDGNEIKAGEDYYQFLNRKAGKTVVLTLKKGAKEWEEYVQPISMAEQSKLLYNRWIKQREHLVDSLSNGRVGYVHIAGMDSPSFREMFSKAKGKYRNCEALIVDTRFNGGGWLHDDVVTFLSGKRYADMTPRGQYIASEPLQKWYKPSCLLVNEGNYSDAHGTAFSYQALKLGKIIGMPVPGTMTAVWWENQINPAIVFGIPQIGMKDMDGNYQENKQLVPDIIVNNTPDSMEEGRDLQIEAAVKEMLSEIDAEK